MVGLDPRFEVGQVLVDLGFVEQGRVVPAVLLPNLGVPQAFPTRSRGRRSPGANWDLTGTYLVTDPPAQLGSRPRARGSSPPVDRWSLASSVRVPSRISHCRVECSVVDAW
jgi:hypothetical protein